MQTSECQLSLVSQCHLGNHLLIVVWAGAVPVPSINHKSFGRLITQEGKKVYMYMVQEMYIRYV